MQDSQGKLKSFVFTGAKETCSGCGACVQVCRHHALTMQPDCEGFLYPVLNTEKCVQCGLCDIICPVTGTNTENKYDNQRCYIATTNEDIYYKESASIGICTMLSNYFVNSGGVVFGSFLDETNWKAYHILVSDENGVQRIRNSKYLQSSTGNTFSQVKEKLNQGITVLYIGTPCQIAGLKSFLHKPYSNLYTVDLVCHGVFSPKLMPLEIKYWEREMGGKIKNFRFRSKRVYKYINGGIVNFDLNKEGKSQHIERYAASSPSYRCYAYAGDGKHYNHRLSCYSCPFRSQHRYGDITVGDPWYIPNNVIDNKLLKSSNSIRSLYSVNTAQGEYIISFIKDLLKEECIDIMIAFTQPAFLSEKRDVPIEREKLYLLINTHDYGEVVEKLLKCKLKDAHIAFVRAYKINKIKNIIFRLKTLIFN